MEEIFFVIKPIWWIVPIHTTSIIIAIVCGISVGVFLSSKSQKKEIKKSQTYIFHPTYPNDPKYAEKTLIEIRKYLTYIYYPKHSWAHISKDICSYIDNPELIEIIEQLENIEYSGIAPEEKQLNLINTTLLKILQV